MPFDNPDTFNPALRDWLNARDYCSGDWPYDVSASMLAAGDLAFGGGYILDENGWPVRLPSHRYADHHDADPIYLGA